MARILRGFGPCFSLRIVSVAGSANLCEMNDFDLYNQLFRRFSRKSLISFIPIVRKRFREQRPIPGQEDYVQSAFAH